MGTETDVYLGKVYISDHPHSRTHSPTSSVGQEGPSLSRPLSYRPRLRTSGTSTFGVGDPSLSDPEGRQSDRVEGTEMTVEDADGGATGETRTDRGRGSRRTLVDELPTRHGETETVTDGLDEPSFIGRPETVHQPPVPSQEDTGYDW